MVLRPLWRRSSLRFEAQRRAAILPKDGTTAFAYVNVTFFLIRLSGKGFSALDRSRRYPAVAAPMT
jgi:hypothetical protein